jgi:hypothetical protein
MRLLVACLVVAAPLRAGVVYDFHTTIETPRYAMKQSGRMWFEGQRYRAEFARAGGREIDVVISRDGDATAMYIDLQKCTWSYRNRIGPVRSSGLFHLPTDSGDTIIGEPVVEHHTETSTNIAGFRATKHVIDVAYRLVGILAETTVRGRVTAQATIWTIDELPSLPVQRDLRTGHPVIDERLAAIAAAMHGMVVRHELVVSRAFDDGVPQTERTVTTLDNLHVSQLPDSLFALPEEAAYVQRGPGS